MLQAAAASFRLAFVLGRAGSTPLKGWDGVSISQVMLSSPYLCGRLWSWMRIKNVINSIPRQGLLFQEGGGEHLGSLAVLRQQLLQPQPQP